MCNGADRAQTRGSHRAVRPLTPIPAPSPSHCSHIPRRRSGPRTPALPSPSFPHTFWASRSGSQVLERRQGTRGRSCCVLRLPGSCNTARLSVPAPVFAKASAERDALCPFPSSTGWKQPGRGEEAAAQPSPPRHLTGLGFWAAAGQNVLALPARSPVLLSLSLLPDRCTQPELFLPSATAALLRLESSN